MGLLCPTSCPLVAALGVRASRGVWSPSWVSRLLSGKRGATELDVAAFLGVCRVKSPERERLLRRGRLAHQQLQRR